MNRWLIKKRLSLLVTLMLLVSGLGQPLLAQSKTASSVFTVFNEEKNGGASRVTSQYYGMVREPGEKSVLAVGGGARELLSYSSDRFRVRTLPGSVFSYGAAWHPDKSFALIVGSILHGQRSHFGLPEKHSGIIMKYHGIDTPVEPIQSGSQGLMDVDFNSKGNALLVGGSPPPNPVRVLLRYRDGSIQPISTPGSNRFPLQSVGWRPGSDRALITSADGSVLVWNGDTVSLSRSVSDSLLSSISWHPSGERALIGADNGYLFQWENNYAERVTSVPNGSIQDVAWQPDGNQALVVGTLTPDDPESKENVATGFWGLYRDGDLRTYPLYSRALSVGWIDDENALIGGAQSLWRYSSSVDSSTIDASPSISLLRRTAQVGDTIVISGFGSTVNGTVGNVEGYQFRIDRGEPIPWQTTPGGLHRFGTPGKHTISLRIRGANGDVSDWIHETVSIKPATTQSAVYWSSRDLLIMVFLLLLGLGVIGWLFREELSRLVSSD